MTTQGQKGSSVCERQLHAPWIWGNIPMPHPCKPSVVDEPFCLESVVSLKECPVLKEVALVQTAEEACGGDRGVPRQHIPTEHCQKLLVHAPAGKGRAGARSWQECKCCRR